MDLNRQVKRFGKQYLVHSGFSQVTKWAFEKSLDGLCQGVGFVKGSGEKDGLYTVDVYWRYTTSPRNAPWAMDCHRRIGELSSGHDEWYAIDDAESYIIVADILLRTAAPFFKAHESIKAVLHSFEARRYDEQLLFGPDAGWRHFNIGFCYLWIGDNEKAAIHLKAVVERYSNENYDWVQERKRLAAEGLDRVAY